MLGAAGVERVGHQAGIVDGGERDAVAGERHHVELGVLHDLEHRLVFENGLEQVERRAHRDLRDRLAAEIEPVAGAVRQRHIGGMPGTSASATPTSSPCIGSDELSFALKAKWP